MTARLWPSLAARAATEPRQDENVEQLQAGAESSRSGGECEAEEEIRDDREDPSVDCERSHQKQKSDQVTPPSRGSDISSQVDLTYFQTEAGPGGAGSERWAEIRPRSEGGDAVRGHHQECGGGPR